MKILIIISGMFFATSAVGNCWYQSQCRRDQVCVKPNKYSIGTCLTNPDVSSEYLKENNKMLKFCRTSDDCNYKEKCKFDAIKNQEMCKQRRMK